jgi:hypothetical protein
LVTTKLEPDMAPPTCMITALRFGAVAALFIVLLGDRALDRPPRRGGDLTQRTRNRVSG